MRFPCCVVILVPSLLAGTASTALGEESPACLLAEAVTALEQDAPEAAAALAARAVHAPLDSRDLAWILLGRAHLRAGRPLEALAAAERAEEAVDGSVRAAQARALRASALSVLGEHAAAARAWADVVSRKGADTAGRVAALLAQAREHEAGEDWAAASAAWRTLAVEHPASSPEDALERSQALAVKAGTPSAVGAADLLRWAERLASANLHARAITAFREAEANLRDTPTVNHAQFQRARSHYQLKENDAAMEACRTVLARQPVSFVRDGCRNVAARTAWRAGDGATLLEMTEPAVAARTTLAPEWADDLLHVRAGYLQEQERWDEAVAVFDELAERFPKADLSAEGKWKAAWCRWLQGRHDDAMQRWDALASKPGGDLANAAELWAGLAAEGAGRADDAVERWTALYRRERFDYHGRLAREALARHLAPEKLSALEAEVEADAVVFVAPPPPPTDTPRLKRHAELRDAGLDAFALDEIEAAWGAQRHTDALAFELARSRSLAGKAAQAHALIAARFHQALLRPSLRSSRELWELVHPRPHAALVHREARRQSIDASLLLAVIQSESWWDERALSAPGARGLMQLMPATAAKLARAEGLAAPAPDDLFRPEINVRLGARYLADLLEIFGGDEAAAIASYNAGEDKVAVWWRDFERLGIDHPAERIQRIPYRETRSYVKRVLEAAGWYRWLAGTAAPAAVAHRAGPR